MAAVLNEWQRYAPLQKSQVNKFKHSSVIEQK
jgi:hypothetical protein